MLPARKFKGLRTIPGYPVTLDKLGDHIRAVRLDRNQLQKDVADFVGVTADTILNWETHQTDVTIPHYPKVMEYLGYCPIPENTGIPTLGALVRLHRIHRGLTLRQAANVIGVDPGALSRWERGETTPLAKFEAKLMRFMCPARKFLPI